MRSDHFDVIVVGVGSMGSAACYYLAKHGLRVLGIEQFDIVHENGSHTGQSRIIRKAYFEHPDYVPLLERSYQNWKVIEKEADTKIYHETGIVYFGHPESEIMHGVDVAAKLYNIALARDRSVKEFPFTIFPDFTLLYEPQAGFITPEVAITSYVKSALKYNCTILTNTKMNTWRKNGNVVEITTDKKTFSADKIIFTSGSWTSKLLPQLNIPLKVTLQTLFWVKLKDSKKFELGTLPCWFIDDREIGLFYGFPSLPEQSFKGPVGLKIALHAPGVSIDADDKIRDLPFKDMEKVINNFMTRYLPDQKNYELQSKTCLYTYSPDSDFIIDFLPGYDDKVIVACGFSGHGFKFVSVVGEVLADLAIKGNTRLPIEFLKLNRFT